MRQPQCPSPSGSIPHEPGQSRPPRLSRSVSLAQRQPRQRSSEPTSCKAQIGLGPLLSGNSSLIATTAWRGNHSIRRVIRGRSLDGGVEIPIVRGTVGPDIPRVPSLKAFGRRPRCAWIGS